MALLEQVSQDVFTVPAEWSVDQAYSKLSGRTFYVEPLSARMPLADFIAGGGLGWGSLEHGSFAAKLYKVQTSGFTFGSNYSTSVNAGYPLHRLLERQTREICPLPDARILRVTVPTRPAPEVKALCRACALPDAAAPVSAANFAWVNKAAASAFSLPDAGSIAFFTEFEPEGKGTLIEGVWDKRFFADAVPPGYSLLKVLTVRSNLGKLEELAAKQGARFFVCVWVHVGVLVCISCAKDALGELKQEAQKLPLTRRLQ